MRGHVRKRGKRWCVVVDIGRDPQTGKRRQRWHSGFQTRREAERALGEITHRLGQGEYVEPTRTTLAVFLEDWLASVHSRLRPSTWDSYKRNIDAHITPALGATPLQALTPTALNRLYADLLSGGRRDGRGGLSPRTVRYCHTILRCALKDAVRWNLAARNVADSADPPRGAATRAKTMKTWSAAELHNFLRHVEDERLYAALLLAATTGMRRGEILGLRWRDIDLSAARIAVRITLITIHNRLEWSTPKTERGRRSVALDPGTVDALRAHRARQAEERLAWGAAYHDHGLVFAKEDGTPIHPDYLTKLFDRKSRALGLPRIRLHDLRHTHATLALQAGIHPKIISERLGHSDITLTLNTYSHAIPALEERAATTIADLIRTASPT